MDRIKKVIAVILIPALFVITMPVNSFANPDPVKVKAGVPVILRLTEEVSSKTKNVNENVAMEVARDVIVDGKIVIKAGTPASGTVSWAEKAGMLGKEGKIQITADSTKTVDGQKAQLRATVTNMGKSETVMSVIMSLLCSVFGDDWFSLKAEAFARFFGTPVFLVGQTVIVAIWIALNAFGYTKFDVYPFILLNLAFSLQAAYAAPLILLAQTRQADRDKAHADADAQHREALAQASQQRETYAASQTDQLLLLLQQNTQLTELVKELSQRIEALTSDVHSKVIKL